MQFESWECEYEKPDRLLVPVLISIEEGGGEIEILFYTHIINRIRIPVRNQMQSKAAFIYKYAQPRYELTSQQSAHLPQRIWESLEFVRHY